jgi:hypothetical protein
LLQVAVL